MSEAGAPAAGSSGGLTHLGPDGGARMVDIGGKPVTAREAVAESFVSVSPAALAAARSGNAPKGSVLETARLAGISGAKACSSLIPLCHPLLLDHADVSAEFRPDGIRLVSRVSCRGATGVEMEALTAAAVAALAVVDMLKALDRGMVIERVRLLEKRGGASGSYRADPGSYRADPAPDQSGA